jgi:hypothetical protein
MSTKLILLEDFIISYICPIVPTNFITYYVTIKGATSFISNNIALGGNLGIITANYETIEKVVREVFEFCKEVAT